MFFDRLRGAMFLRWRDGDGAPRASGREGERGRPDSKATMYFQLYPDFSDHIAESVCASHIKAEGLLPDHNFLGVPTEIWRGAQDSNPSNPGSEKYCPGFYPL